MLNFRSQVCRPGLSIIHYALIFNRIKGYLYNAAGYTGLPGPGTVPAPAP